jgi:hypothetical protein
LRELQLELVTAVGDNRRKNLHLYEICCLANFVDDQTTIDEITTVVPSLNRFSRADLEIAINIVVEAKACAS